MKKIRIYMPLINEGTDVIRPVVAYNIGNNIYKILGTEQGLSPEDLYEEWEFSIGSYVIVEEQIRSGGKVLVAIKEQTFMCGVNSK